MLEICAFEKCTGCLACLGSCPKNAIYEELDELGFRRPHINQNLCIDCGLCVIICPSNNEPITNPVSKTYALTAKDTSLLQSVSSGGIATLIGENFISKGGVVYGCTGSDIYDIKYIRVSDKDQISLLKGSKYIQARIAHVYSNIKDDLNKGKKVLVIGISCQLAGLRNYLRKKCDNLYLIDIICHGGASQQMVTQNMNYYKDKLSLNDVSDVRFRRKIVSASGPSIKYGFYFNGDGSQFVYEGSDDMFTLGYATNLLFRDSCYQCQYTKLDRVSDLTLGDFWLLPKDSKLSKSNGVSVCLTHTQKGEDILKWIDEQVVSEQRTIQEAVCGNPQLVKPSTPGLKIKEFRQKYIKSGLVASIRSVHRKRLFKHRVLKIVMRYPILRHLYLAIRCNDTCR